MGLFRGAGCGGQGYTVHMFDDGMLPCDPAGVVPSGGGAPTEVAGPGPQPVSVPAATAWCLAGGGTWRRLVIAPVGATVIDLARTRDRGCVFPTCQSVFPTCQTPAY